MPHRNMSDLSNLTESLKKLTGNKPKHLLITGDFNCPDINWKHLSVNPGAPNHDVQQELINLSVDMNLNQIHEYPTRGNNMLDLVFTTNSTLIKSSVNAPGLSDHDMVITDCDIKPSYSKQKPRKCYQYNKANWENINKEIQEISDTVLQQTAAGECTQGLWNTLKERVLQVLDKHVPHKLKRKNASPPWLNKTLKKMTKRKARLHKQAKKTGKWENFRFYQKECKRHFRQTELNYVNKTIQEGLEQNNSKPFWRYIKSKRQDHIGVSPLKKKGVLVDDSKKKANILIDQFSSVFTKDEKDSHEMPQMESKCNSSIPPLIIRQAGVAKLLKKINVTKAPGPDAIPNIILKNCAEQIAPAMTAIFQSSIDSGRLPVDWTNANIAPIYKKSDRHLAENYRPVSLTSVACKTLEHIVCRHLLTHLEKHQLLTKLNHGFRAGYSCDTQLIVTMHDLLKSYDKGAQVDVVVLDFSKAFDTVPHDKLLYKLQQYGIQGTIHQWLTSFLKNRYMRVVVDGEFSERAKVESGVPQGTVLGPLLFLCHINDLPECVRSKVRLFADDCLLYREIKSQKDHVALQNDLKELEQWASNWGMRFNAKKCFIMSIRNKSSHFYTLGDHILQQVSETPYLGLTLSEDMKWSTHITKKTKKANSTLGFLRRNLRQCPKPCKHLAYISLVRPILEYGAAVWDPYLQQDIDKLEKTQRLAARFIVRDYKSREDGCVTKMLQDLKLPSLRERRRQIRLVMFYKVAMNLTPAIDPTEYLTPLRKKRQIKAKQFRDYQSANIVERSVNNNSKCFVLENAKTQNYRFSFFINTAYDWNHLEDSIVCAETLEDFKISLQNCY